MPLPSRQPPQPPFRQQNAAQEARLLPSLRLQSARPVVGVKAVVTARARKAAGMRSPVRGMVRAVAPPALAARRAFVQSAVHLALSVRRRSLPRLERWSRSRRLQRLLRPRHSALPPGEAMGTQAIETEPWRTRLAVARARLARAHSGPVRQVRMIYYRPPAGEARRGCASSTSPRPWREFAPARSTAHVRHVRQFPGPYRRVRHRPVSSAPCPRMS